MIVQTVLMSRERNEFQLSTRKKVKKNDVIMFITMNMITSFPILEILEIWKFSILPGRAFQHC